MRIYIFLIFVCASALARSKYKRETSQGISFSDKAGISAGLNGAEGHFKKSIGLKPFLLNPFDTTSENKGIDLNIGGNVGLKPKLNFGEKGVGISLGGSGDLGVGISGSKEKKHSEKKHSKKHKQSKENSSSEKSSEESVIGEIWKEINNGISAGVKGDAGFSIGTGGISASIGGDVSAGANSKNDGSSSSNEEEVIIIPIVDGENSGSYEISDETKINKTNVKGVIIIGDKETSLGDKEKSDNSSGNKNKKHVDKNGSEKHQNEHSGKKEEYSKHSGKDIITSHDKSESNKEHVNKNRNNNNHTREEGGIVISHEEHNSQNKSKGHQGLSKENETKNSGITEGSKNTHTGGSITKSHNSGGKTSSEHKERNNVKLEQEKILGTKMIREHT
ncbi:GATA zinc finger domain-containing protein 14-like isoform X1 [Pseudomyrmex gracilis]|uniref:GATA zinc finger domain-containing protein 14-like isoform X1 n=1 Tax=Pseudomyrmex gracilis TaxID=219809 RepID=UPI00099513E4|nr:GATA zinc finger domain-containing protein 14-like isoform X1 [Pseudomyrmex gracilis]